MLSLAGEMAPNAILQCTSLHQIRQDGRTGAKVTFEAFGAVIPRQCPLGMHACNQETAEWEWVFCCYCHEPTSASIGGSYCTDTCLDTGLPTSQAVQTESALSIYVSDPNAVEIKY